MRPKTENGGDQPVLYCVEPETLDLIDQLKADNEELRAELGEVWRFLYQAFEGRFWSSMN